MGNCFSAPESTGDTLAAWLQQSREPLVPLTVETMQRGLQDVANTLNERGENVSIVAVGGAVSTLYLQSRAQTSDVDFFYSTTTNDEHLAAVRQAAQHAATTINVTPQWLNNHTATFIGESRLPALYNESLQQGVVVFQAPGLRVYAAPWHYALVTKIHRLSKATDADKQDNDLSDAVEFLHKIIERQDNRAVTREDIQRWFTEYGIKEKPSDDVLVRVQDAYHGKYLGTGIDLPKDQPGPSQPIHDELR